MENLNRLLLRQLNKYLPDYSIHPGGLSRFIEAVNQSYIHFEQNHELIQRATRLSSDELSESNLKLRNESQRQQLILQSLKEAITSLSPDDIIVDDDDLLKIIDILHHEIEQRKKVESDLQLAKQAAEKSLQIKKIFLANISHEIRTPINAVVGMSSLLAESELTDVQREYLEAIKSSAENLMVIINDVLDISKLESGKFEIEHIPFRIDFLFKSLIRNLSIKAEEKNIAFTSSLDPNLNEYFIGDPTRINQVLTNLVSNAIKFTHEGRVDLKAQLISPPHEQQRVVRFSVCDTGVGIAQDKLESIFEYYTQEDVSITRNYGGTGLGLAISKELVELMNSKLEVESEKGKGSTFSFDIQMMVSDNAAINRSVQADVKDLHRARILLVEDNEMNRYLCYTILTNWNCVVDTASNGQLALTKLESMVYDLILMDIQMPEMGGFEATRAIRETMKLTTPIIAISANTERTEYEQCLALGMNDYLAKPYRPDELYHKINNALSRSGGDALTAAKPLLFSLDKLNALYQGNALHVEKTVSIFISQMENDVKTLVAKWKLKDFDAVKNIAHKMRPNIELFGITKLEHAAVEIIKHAEANQYDKLADSIQQVERVVAEVIRELTATSIS